MSFQFNEVCRTCATESKNLINMFEAGEHGETLAEKIYMCTQMLIKEKFDRPSTMCDNCETMLEVAYNFMNLVKRSELTFELLQNANTLSSTNEEIVEPVEFHVVKIEIDHDDNFVEPEAIAAITTTAEYRDVNSAIKNDQRECDSTKVNAKISKKCGNTQNKNDNTRELEKKTAKENKSQHFECYKCKQRFTSFWKTRIHLKQHDAEEKFKCTVCGSRFIEWDDFNRHLCQGTEMKCSYCDEVFAATVSLLSHLDQAHNEKTLFKCERCGRFFSMLLLKQIHMLQQHFDENTEDNKPFVCKICKKGFATKISLRNHEEIHSDEKLFLCFECGKRFKTSSSLHTHRICHSEKTIKCPDCPMTFNRIAGFRKHRDVHLNLKYKCNLCRTELKSKDALERHERRHRLTDNDKKHQCTFCPMKFFKKDKLTRHIRTHTGEKPFKCPFCSDRAYAQKGDLTKHIKQKHVGNNIYSCEICKEGFQYYVDLKNHSFEHYKEDKAKQQMSNN